MAQKRKRKKVKYELQNIFSSKIFQTSLPPGRADPIVKKWMPIVNRTERDVKCMDFTDELVTLQVSTSKHEIILGFGQAFGDPKKKFGIVVHQLCHESAVPNQLKKAVDSRLSRVQEKPKDPREDITNFQTILDFRKKIWNDKPEEVYPENDPQLIYEQYTKEMELIKELRNVPPNRGHRRIGREIEIFYHFLSRCKLGPPDPKTGKRKWKWLGEPVVKDFGLPNRLTIQMAQEFSKANEELEKAASDMEKIIEDGDIIEETAKEETRKRIQKQKIKILLKKLEELRKKRMNKEWRKKCLKRRY